MGDGDGPAVGVAAVGADVVETDVASVGGMDGALVGKVVGGTEGKLVGGTDARGYVGAADGKPQCNCRRRSGPACVHDGEPVGSEVVGDSVGSEVVGDTDGDVVGSEVVGEADGEVVRSEVVGEVVGSEVVGETDGNTVGDDVVGSTVGDRVGEDVDGAMLNPMSDGCPRVQLTMTLPGTYSAESHGQRSETSGCICTCSGRLTDVTGLPRNA